MADIALHVSPHPDDEILGCGATLLGLVAAGWRVVNLAVGLGRPADHARRRRELAAALDVLGLEGRVAEPPLALGASDDLARAEAAVTELVSFTVASLGAALVLSPHPDDAHHGHAVVGRAVRAVAGIDRWWAWGLWRDLPAPNRYVPWGEATARTLAAALACHRGEVARNGYADLITARGRVQAVLGSERVGGFGGGPLSPEPYADLLEERVRVGSGLELAAGHVVGLGELVDPHPDRLDRGADAVVHGVGDGPQ